MKKIILTLLLTLSITISSFAWTIDLGSGTFYAIAGVSYGIAPCSGVGPSATVLSIVSGDPFSYLICDGVNQKAMYRNCPGELAFNPTSMVCDLRAEVAPQYPDFPWGDY